MQKLVFTLIAMAAFNFSYSQSFKFSVGYGIPWISQTIGTNVNTAFTTTIDPVTGYESSASTSTSENVKGSYGAGWNANGAFCYALSENIGLELGLGYVNSKRYTTASNYQETLTDGSTAFSYESETSKSRAVLFTPALRFITQKRKVTPYILVGPVFGKINLRRSMTRSSEENGVVSNESSSSKFKGGISVGLRGAVGVSVALNRKLSLFSEITFVGMNYFPKESVITHYAVNGEDKSSSLPENIRKTIYVDKVETKSHNTTDNSNIPGRKLRFPVSMSSVSANAGVQVKLQ